MSHTNDLKSEIQVRSATEKMQKPLLSSQERKVKIDQALSETNGGTKPKITSNPLASFCYYPKHAGFISKDPEEEVVLLIRKHPITNVKWIIIATLMLGVPLVLEIFPFFTALPEPYQFVLILIWYLLVSTYVLESFLGWFFNVNIVTDERVVDVDFHNLIFREVTDANLDQIQDVTVKIGGGARTFFNFGNVYIQTASQIPEIEFIDVPKPDQIASVLRELRVEEEMEKIEGRVR